LKFRMNHSQYDSNVVSAGCGSDPLLAVQDLDARSDTEFGLTGVLSQITSNGCALSFISVRLPAHIKRVWPRSRPGLRKHSLPAPGMDPEESKHGSQQQKETAVLYQAICHRATPL
jgi:hypothetical protein